MKIIKVFTSKKKKNLRVKGAVIKIRPRAYETTRSEFAYAGENMYEYKVALSGHYRLEAWGANGGGGNTGPKGAYSKSIISLKKDEIIKILVGEKGFSGKNYQDSDGWNWIYCGGGGGGTFIAKGSKPLCVAGGGGAFTIFSSPLTTLIPIASKE